MSSNVYAVQPSMESDLLAPGNQTSNSEIGYSFNGGTVLLDTCFVLNSLWDELEATILEILTKNGNTLCITNTISREIDRMCYRYSSNVRNEQSYRALLKHLTFLNDSDPDVISESRWINIHAPDNIHIATAKIHGASIISSDNEMLQIAQDEGVPAYRPVEMVGGLLHQTQGLPV